MDQVDDHGIGIQESRFIFFQLFQRCAEKQQPAQGVDQSLRGQLGHVLSGNIFQRYAGHHVFFEFPHQQRAGQQKDSQAGGEMAPQPSANGLFVNGAHASQHEDKTVEQGQVVHALVQQADDHGMALGPGRIIPVGGAPVI